MDMKRLMTSISLATILFLSSNCVTTLIPNNTDNFTNSIESKISDEQLEMIVSKIKNKESVEIIIDDKGNILSGPFKTQWVQQIGKYSVRLDFHYHQVNGCNNTRPIHHINAAIELYGQPKYQNEVINLHIGAWRENGRICFCIYESKSGKGGKICSPTKDDLKNVIAPILVSVGISVAVAYAIAEILAWLGIGVLVFTV